MTASDLARRRLCNQKLLRTGFRTPAEVVAWLGAVQAQDFAGATWAIGQRARGLTAAAVVAAFDAGEILRTHLLRPTWHLVARGDLRWMLALSAPRVHAANASMYRRLGVDAGVVGRSQTVFNHALENHRSLTRKELAAALKDAGIEAHGQRLACIVMRAELDAVLCSGPVHGKQFTYALVDERTPPAPPLDDDEALATLAVRYFRSHGPATLRDFGWWSGLTRQQVRTAVAAAGRALELCTGDDLAYWQAPASRIAAVTSPTAHLLPNYDEYFVAYRDRAVLGAASRLRASTGVRFDAFGHLLAVDGLLAGTWRSPGSAGHEALTVAPHWRLTHAEYAAVSAAAAAFGAFRGVDSTIAWV
ncbi:MAG TPA: winged helix DNA-binding domain-containing protein [Vicinamibacterales bacterium]|nr:winged helix DNA-binding domain-containing protein [Vicinamibacterales bacterium]